MVKTIRAQFWLSLNQLGFSEGDVCMSSFFHFIELSLLTLTGRLFMRGFQAIV